MAFASLRNHYSRCFPWCCQCSCWDWPLAPGPAGDFIASLVEKTGLSAVVFYAGAELLIGLGAFAVPKLFAAGEYFLLAAGQTNSIGYLSLSALVLAFSILPWCVCMGATFPLMMAYVRERDCKNTASFQFSVPANVLGAMSGHAFDRGGSGGTVGVFATRFWWCCRRQFKRSPSSAVIWAGSSEVLWPML